MPIELAIEWLHLGLMTLVLIAVFGFGRFVERNVRKTAHPSMRALKSELTQVQERIDGAIHGDIFARYVELEQRRLIRGASSNPIVISVCNFKGGVGKTTLSLNLGAFFADTENLYGCQNKRVLFIDLDYQASLTSMLCAPSREQPKNQIVGLFDKVTNAERVLSKARPVRSDRMMGCAFIGADFDLATFEERLIFDWALGRRGEDVRFQLLQFLSSPEVREYDMVIFDCPPRQTILTINALVASTHFLVPTKLDRLSGRAPEGFFRELHDLKTKLWPRLQSLGVVGTFTRSDRTANAVETETRRTIEASSLRAWGHRVTVYDATLPTRVSIASAAGTRDFAYFDEAASGGSSPYELFTRIGCETARRLGYDVRTADQERVGAF